jgi:hypothetical protein
MVGYLAALQFSQVRGVVWVEELPLLDPEQAAVETARISPKAKVVSFFNSRLHSIIRVSAGTAWRSKSFQLSAPLDALWRLTEIMEDRTYVVHATWDDEAKVWVAESEDVPGLVTEPKDLDALMDKLRVMVPELLELNGCPPEDHSPDV